MDLGLCVVFVNRSLCEVLFLLVIVLYVLLLFIAYNYPFGISKLIYSYIYMNSRYKLTSNPLSEVIFCKCFFFGGKHLLACGKLTWSYHLSMVDNLPLDLFNWSVCKFFKSWKWAVTYMCDTVIVFALFLRFSDFWNALAMPYVLFIILLSTSKNRKCVTRHQVSELVIVD
jgi:hypothetical protein